MDNQPSPPRRFGGPRAGRRAARTGSARGIGLVEVVVAAGLFAALAAGVAHLFTMSARSLVLARHRTSSLVLAVDKIEQLRAGGGPWGAPVAAGTVQTEFLSAGGGPPGPGGAPSGGVYRRVTSVRASAARPGTLIVEVRVVAGPGGDGAAALEPAPHEVVLVTLLPAPEGS